MAATPYYDELCENYPQTLLEASGSRVGLPEGVMGNSEVGHLNIGAGRVIRMDVSRVDHDIATGEFFRNPVLLAAMDRIKKLRKALHLMGLVSDGQVHSSQGHLYALLRLAKQCGLERVFIHCFLDGRDTPPSSAAHYVAALQKKTKEIGSGQIASLIGRYYAMDRDKRWERTQRAFELLVRGKGEPATDPVAAVLRSYERGITDEFIEPTVVINADSEPVATIQDGEAVIFFNFRPDRARQLTSALVIPGFAEFDVSSRPQIDFVCFTVYERCLLVPSPRISTYDLQPEMSAFKVTDRVLRAIEERETDIFIINFANPDMVGHTGKLDKTIEACQFVDTCLGWITKGIRQARGSTIITADHGNAEQMIDPQSGEPHTAHTTNPVPFHLIDDASRGLKLRAAGALEDVAPTLLGLLGNDKPKEMTGRDLRDLD